MHEEPIENYIVDVNDMPDTSSPFQINCAFCSGTGVHPGTMKSLNYTSCPVCGGTGILKFPSGRSDYTKCSRCQGIGREPNSTEIKICGTCDGHGIVESV